MELDLQSLFGLLFTAVLIGWDPATHPFPHLGSYTWALLSSQDRRHLFITPWKSPMASNARILCRTLWYALQGKSHVCIPFLGMARPCSKFPHSCVCERFIYSQDRSTYCISCSRIGRSIVGIYKSLTDTWMWKLGLWLRNSFSGIFVFNFSVLVLCSVESSRITLPGSWIPATYF